MNAAEVKAATGVSSPTLYRIRRRSQDTVYRATEARIRAYVANAKQRFMGVFETGFGTISGTTIKMIVENKGPANGNRCGAFI
jgi:hypothetical protein